MKTFDTAVYNSYDQTGLDVEIISIQKAISKISFIEAIFGKAEAQMREHELEGKILFPLTKKLNSDFDLTPNDQYASYCFFTLEKDSTIGPKTDTQDFTESNVQIEQDVNLYFFGNLLKLEIDNPEIIKSALIYQLSKLPKIIIKKITEDQDSIWEGFTMTDSINGFANNPNCAYKITFTLNYQMFDYNGLSVFNHSAYINEQKTFNLNNNNGYGSGS